MDDQLDPQKVHIGKYYQQESLMACSDPAVIKIHLQSSLSLNLTHVINLMIYLYNSEQITEKGNKVLTTTITAEIQN